MAEAGIYALTKVLVGGVSAIMTGPMGSVDLPDVDLHQAIAGSPTGYTARIQDVEGSYMGLSGEDRGTSPSVRDLPDHFIQALISIEDADFGRHPGVDPFATFSAALDTLRGDPRGGSTLTQQLVKNAITGNEVTLERKIKEAILAIRASRVLSNDEVLQSYLAKAWFGRSQSGATGAAHAWFGKSWSRIELHEAAFLAGLLKGPAYYDPDKYPERAKARRDLVLGQMLRSGYISREEHEEATAKPIGVVPDANRPDRRDGLPHFVDSAIGFDMNRFQISRDLASATGDVLITTTMSKQWQEIAQKALSEHVTRIGRSGPAASLKLPALPADGSLTGRAIEDLRSEASTHVATTARTGRAIIWEVKAGLARAAIDRGFGPLEWAEVKADSKELGFTPKAGDVMPYVRVDGVITLRPVPQVQSAAVVMDTRTGAILASVGSSDPVLYPLDRTRAMRQPGSAIKPFLWIRAMEDGLGWDDLVDDVERSYKTGTGEMWRPRNYDGKASGLVPLYLALEQSSNLVAAHLMSLVGPDAMAEVAELAGVYDYGTMRRHVSAALGVSETTLPRLLAGYASIANDGMVVTPHSIADVTRGGHTIWSSDTLKPEYAMATSATVQDVTAMLYGVTQRGTAASGFRGFTMPVAGKTGTTQDYRDAWLISFTPGIAVGVWVGRDDNKSIPGNLTGSRAAVPIARGIYQGGLDQGLLDESGFRTAQEQWTPWPPQLLRRGNSRTNYMITPQADMFKRALPGEAAERDYLSQSDEGFAMMPEDSFEMDAGGVSIEEQILRDISGTMLREQSIGAEADELVTVPGGDIGAGGSASQYEGADGYQYQGEDEQPRTSGSGYLDGGSGGSSTGGTGSGSGYLNFTF